MFCLFVFLFSGFRGFSVASRVSVMGVLALKTWPLSIPVATSAVPGAVLLLLAANPLPQPLSSKFQLHRWAGDLRT